MRTCLIPMAGSGRRFAEAGYSFPKPLIDVAGKPMIQRVVENLPSADRWVFVAQREHCDRYAVRDLLSLLVRDPIVVETDGVTEGAACTALLAREHLEGELLIANSDQIVEWRGPVMWGTIGVIGARGAVATFKATHPKWSFVRVNDGGWVTEVVEKRPISNRATCGVYWWRDAGDFVRFANEMIKADDRVNGEFYIAPVYNHLLKAGGRVREVPVPGMHGLGTPEDLQAYLAWLK